MACGVYCCMYAEQVAVDSPLNFTQDDATLKRQLYGTQLYSIILKIL